jgi:gliding motility-associated-like protein
MMYYIYYAPTDASDYILLHTSAGADDTTFMHDGLSTIAGCYAIVAIDSANNVSDYSNLVCLDIDICPAYSLPNVFTPNNDGYNDLLIPFPYEFVEKVDFRLYNRWGKLVFQTADPDIKWNGENQHTGMVSAVGVYYYVCDVWERRLGGLVKRTLTGFVHLVR